jgi:nitrite reductase (NADH) large subunit
LNLRTWDLTGEIIIISNENHVFYKRSKIISLISESCTEDDLFLKGKEVYEREGIKFRLGQVKKIIPKENLVLLEDNSELSYDFLLIASGGSPIIFPWEGVNLEGISTLYTLDDAKKVIRWINKDMRVVIIGGGSIAIKVVQNFIKMGLKISIVEKASHLWPIGFDRKTSRILEGELEKKGVQIYLNEEVVGFKGENGKVKSVSLKSQKELPCDIAIITVGMRPNISFLKNSGIIIENGVIVDKYLRTNIKNILAAGDVAQMEDPLYRKSILHPTWGNAKKQGKLAAKNMTGNQKEYTGVIPIQSIGLLGYKAIAVGISHSKRNYDEVSAVSFQKGTCRKFVFENNRLVGALVLGKGINKKELKPLLKRVVLEKVNLSQFKTDLLREDFNFNSLYALKSLSIG